LTKYFKNKGHQGNPKKRIVQPNVTEIDHLTSEVLKMSMSCVVFKVNLMSCVVFKVNLMSCVVFKVNLIKNLKQWWVETGATRHVCVEKMMFSSYKEMDEENLYMRNSSTSKVLVVGKVILKMTFEKLFTLSNANYIVDIRKNLVFGSLLSKNSIKMVLKSDKYIFSKSDMFVEKMYLCDELFKMNIMIIVTNDENNNKSVSSFYLFESYGVWHSKLSHVKPKTL
jgi:hypothetical protein